MTQESPAALLRRLGLHAKQKRLGQCFLHDRAVVERIVRHSGVGRDDTAVEIGAGLGILTRALAARAARVVAVEKDPQLAAALRQELAGPGVEVLCLDALTLDLRQLSPPVAVVGNLPYNITSPLLFHLLDQRCCFASATFMVQKEVADRLAAPPGSRTYGAPSVLCQRVAAIQRCFVVGRGAFFPVPRVDSAVIHLRILDQPRAEVDPRLFHQVVHAAFAQRRKTLRKSLSAVFPLELVEAALRHSGVDHALRAEALSVEQFGALTAAVELLSR